VELKIRRGEFLPACLKRQFLGYFCRARTAGALTSRDANHERTQTADVAQPN